MCKVKIARVVRYPVRIHASLLFVVSRPSGTTAYLATIHTYPPSLKICRYDLHIKASSNPNAI